MENFEWSRDHLVQALKLKGYTLSMVAKELQISYAIVRYGLEKGTPAELRSFVSRELKTPEWCIWPKLFPPQWRESGPPQ
jgi:lambda repressor-like predicted transcriptional regulator